MNTIKEEKLNCLGNVWNGYITSKHWFEFADNTTLVSALKSDNQLLCNGFLKCSSWTDMIVRISKCHVFVMKKQKSI